MIRTLLAKLISKLTGGGHGFIKQDIPAEDWMFGAIGGDVIREDGQWVDFIPKDEPQRRRVETMNCTNYGTMNALETLHKALYDEEIDYSERYGGILSGTTVRGNLAERPCETIRKKGMILESQLPFDDSIKSWNAYYSPKPMTEDLLQAGQDWLDNYEFLHEWVRATPNNLKAALKYSPLGVSVYAWAKNSQGMYYKARPENHWTCLVGYKEGEYWLVFDSYAPHLKKIPWSNTFGFAKRYYLKRTKTKKEVDQNFYNSMIGQFVLRVNANGELYKVEEEVLKKVNFQISDPDIWKAVHVTLRPMITGITEPNFLRLSRVAKNLRGIEEPDEDIELKGFFDIN
tara:strand:- start:2832 stop:3863 length:1032 start_codon:yes stop_codon:yes gene_type:complete